MYVVYIYIYTTYSVYVCIYVCIYTTLYNHQIVELGCSCFS
jgi:hypothetical protein